jgi:hypothetical protein
MGSKALQRELCVSRDRATLAKTLPSHSFKPVTSRRVLKLSRTKLFVIYLRPRNVSPIASISL